jgi:hypothetical protein
MGEAKSINDAVEAIVCWMKGDSVADLHRRFAFVDARMRVLDAIRRELLKRCPDLKEADVQLVDRSSREFDLRIVKGDRSCTIAYRGETNIPDGQFSWGTTRLFKVHTSRIKRLAPLVQRWICDRAMPSVFQVEFPSIEMGGAASFYEAGRQIEGDFVASWDYVEQFYRRLHRRWKRYAKILHLVHDLRNAGFDQTLRAGLSHTRLILSRCRYDGALNGQPTVMFEFRDNGMTFHVRREEVARFENVALTPEIERALRELEKHPIDWSPGWEADPG